jgi:hypothetical protein
VPGEPIGARGSSIPRADLEAEERARGQERRKRRREWGNHRAALPGGGRRRRRRVIGCYQALSGKRPGTRRLAEPNGEPLTLAYRSRRRVSHGALTFNPRAHSELADTPRRLMQAGAPLSWHPRPITTTSCPIKTRERLPVRPDLATLTYSGRTVTSSNGGPTHGLVPVI